MRLNEFLSNEEWVRMQRLIYSSVWEALNAYQQQRTAHQPYPVKAATAKLKPQAAKKVRTLARKAKRPPVAARPKPLPKPKQQPQVQSTATPAYQPVKAPTPLPPSTKTVAARTQPRPTLKPPPQSAKIPPSMQPLPSGLAANIQAKVDPVAQQNSQQIRGSKAGRAVV